MFIGDLRILKLQYTYTLEVFCVIAQFFSKCECQSNDNFSEMFYVNHLLAIILPLIPPRLYLRFFSLELVHQLMTHRHKNTKFVCNLPI